ncbi:MAG: response regulator [Candidatus Promineifilaceae bacterium]
MTQKKRILIVDDDKMIVWLIEQSLKSDSYEIFTAYNGADALEKAYKIHPNLMILDLNMPVMDGYEVCRQLHKDAKMADISLLLLSALVNPNASDEDGKLGVVRRHLKGLDLGVDAFLSKPIRLKELKTRVETMMTEPVAVPAFV